MSIRLSDIIIFAAGAIIGSVVTYKLAESKFEQIAREEKEATEKYYKEEKEAFEDILCDVYKKLARDYSEPETESEKEENNMTVDKPYVITPEEFGELDYETISLDYFADGVIVDEFDEHIDIEELGIDPAEHFGEYEDDSVFIRDDARKCDYEILRDLRNYYDVYHTEK